MPLTFVIASQGIGLSVEEAIIFWRKSFSNITDDKFTKEYKYNIRHGYGLEGSRKSYSPKRYTSESSFSSSPPTANTSPPLQQLHSDHHGQDARPR